MKISHGDIVTEARLGRISSTFGLRKVALLNSCPQRFVELGIKHGCGSGSRFVVRQYIFLDGGTAVWKVGVSECSMEKRDTKVNKSLETAIQSERRLTCCHCAL